MTNSIHIMSKSPCLSLGLIDFANFVEHGIDLDVLHAEIILTRRKLLIERAHARTTSETMPKNMIPWRVRLIEMRCLRPEKSHHINRRECRKMGGATVISDQHVGKPEDD